MKDEIKRLKALQEVDLEIGKVERELAVGSEELSNLQESIEKHKADIAENTAKLEDVGVRQRELEAEHIRFQPGLNEDLAANAVWGSQQTDIFGSTKYDGVFGLWYGKNPGLDRSGDAMKHANLNGTSRHGGVLAISADDPGFPATK